jgi:hypothetical protein
MPIDVERFYQELESLGEGQVRRDVASHRWGRGEHHGLAVAWLAIRDQSRKDASNSEQMRIAQSAKNAAWTAAIAAIIAAIMAGVSIWIVLSS